MRRYGWLLAITGLGLWWASSFTAADANPAPPEPTVGSLPVAKEATLATSDASRGALLGAGVAIEGNTALVGARFAPSAYIFRRREGRWRLEEKLTPEDEEELSFGESVVLEGDTAIVGAPWADEEEAKNMGAAYVFERGSDGWHRRQRLTATDASKGDGFGVALALEDDTAIVGATGVDRGDVEAAGAAYVFERTEERWKQRQKLTAPDPTKRDTFGGSVDLDGETAVVGAYRYDARGTDRAGAVFVFDRRGGKFLPTHTLSADDGNKRDFFGYSVALDGETLLVGAEQDRPDGLELAGSAYIFTRRDGDWHQHQRLVASDVDDHSGFGSAVALDGDTAVVGSIYNNAGSDRDGAAYLFTRIEDAWIERRKLTDDDPNRKGFMGIDAALDGDAILVGVGGDHPPEMGRTGSGFVYRIGARGENKTEN